MMKNFLIGSIALLGAMFMPAVSAAQQMPQLPTDTAVVSGVLPNGLTYYIRHNATPKGQADFHIAQKVGSVLEKDNQRGLAHFLEHMCFNGTKNFPGNSLISYLESIGVKFGNHLNAYTGTDETVYKITNVPTARTEVTDSVLLILHDWANELLLDPEEIDKERGVIHEEWRTSNVGQMRILEQLLPVMYPGSQYGHRLPIGTMEVVDNFPHQALRDYYEAWYRPDLQGIVVCGDIDPKRTEQVIKKMFSDIEMPAGAPMRIEYPVPDTPGTIYAIGADKEMTSSIVYLMFKGDVIPPMLRNTQAYFVIDYIRDMITSMLNARFSEMMSDPATPFAFAQSSVGNYFMSNSKDMFAVIGAAKDGDIAKTLRSIYREVLRAKRGGFTQTEYDRSRAEFLAGLDRAYNNRASIENPVYTNDMIRHFIDGTPMTDMETEYQLKQQIAQLLDLATINATFNEMVTDDNRVVLCMLPDSAPLPTEAGLDAMMKSVDAEEIEVFTDNVREDPLIPVAPQPGKIESTAPVSAFEGTECLTLSNGAKVYLKHTDFKADEIIFLATAPGGLSKYSQHISPIDARAMKVLGAQFGIGSYTASDLEKYLAGKKVSLNQACGIYASTLSGSATPKDLPTLMELIYGYFTAVSYPESEFEASRSLYYGLMENQEKDPQFVFNKDLMQAFYESPYIQSTTASDLQNCSRTGIESFVRTLVADASQWSFLFVGNFNKETLLPMLETYVASLPSTGTEAHYADSADPAFEMRAGSATDKFTTAMQTPQTYCAVIESATVPFTSVNAKLASVAGQILSARLLKNIREEMGAVYSIGAYGDIDPEVGRNAAISTSFPMNPEKTDEVLAAIAAEFDAMAENITDEELNKVKEYMVKSYIERKEKNDAQASYLLQWIRTGLNLLDQAVDEVNAITPADVQKFVKEMNAQNNYRVVLLEPQS